MPGNGLITNTPHFLKNAGQRGFQEVWYLKFNDLQAARALWLRFTVLIGRNRSKEIAEVWSIFFDRGQKEVKKVGVKQTFPLTSFTVLNDREFHIGENVFKETGTSGAIEDGSNRIQWDFSITPGPPENHDFIPKSLKRLGLTHNAALTVHEHQFYSGWCEINGDRFDWKVSPGMQGHLSGPRNGHSWVWGHCNTFTDETGSPAPLLWDGLIARASIGKIVLPPLPSMYFRLENQHWVFNTLRDTVRVNSSHGYNGWQFTAEKRGFRFAGNIMARLEDFAGVTYEDTDGSNLYCHNTKVCDFSLSITTPGESPRWYFAHGSTAYEVVTREAHPGITFII